MTSESRKRASKKWYDANPEKRAEINRRIYNRHKKTVFDHYGNKCACCGLDDIRFLTVDHVNNDGYKEREGRRKGAGVTRYIKIIRQNFPDSFQLLCWNCNCAKAHNKGVCPHKETQ